MKFGILATMFVEAIEPFPVNSSKDQINIDLSRDQIIVLRKILDDAINKSDYEHLYAIRIRLEGKFYKEHV